MSSIDPSHRLDALLREHLARLRERGRAARPRESGARNLDAARTELLATQVASLDPADPDRKQKAVLLFLQSELAREFGAAILNDPGFSGMLDAIHGQMRADAAIDDVLERLGDLLVHGRPA